MAAEKSSLVTDLESCPNSLNGGRYKDYLRNVSNGPKYKKNRSIGVWWRTPLIPALRMSGRWFFSLLPPATSRGTKGIEPRDCSTTELHPQTQTNPRYYFCCFSTAGGEVVASLYSS